MVGRERLSVRCREEDGGSKGDRRPCAAGALVRVQWTRAFGLDSGGDEYA